MNHYPVIQTEGSRISCLRSNILFSALVGFAVLVNPMADFYTKYYITVITILWATTFSLLVLFLPKVHAFWQQRRKEQRQKDSQTSSREHKLHDTTSAPRSGLLATLFRNVSDAVLRVSPGMGPPPPDLVSLEQVFSERGNTRRQQQYVEVHEGEMPVRRVFRYFPLLAHWEMEHIMVFPWLGYFSYFSERTKEGAVMSYVEATVYSAQLEDYVLKVTGQGWYDMYIQLPDLDALHTWQRTFNCQHQDSKKGSNQQQEYSFLCTPDDTNDVSSPLPHHSHYQHSTHQLLPRRESAQSSVTTVAVHD